MCLILLGYQAVPGVDLLILANRDEFYDRPALPAHYWDSPAPLLAGRDLVSGGTWLGVDPKGRVAAITNFRQGMPNGAKPRSRGNLPVDFLTGTKSAEDFIVQCRRNRRDYGGYNLLLSDHTGLWHYCSALDKYQSILPGVHGLSNHSLNTPWPKIINGKQSLSSCLKRDCLESESLFALMRDETAVAPEFLPDTGVGLEWETTLSSLFIRSETYGTRSSSLLIIRKGGQIEFNEINYSPNTETSSTDNHIQKFVFTAN